MLTVWKNALELFVWNKHLLNKQHEFAVVILRDKAEWVSQLAFNQSDLSIIIMATTLITASVLFLFDFETNLNENYYFINFVLFSSVL